MGFNVDGGKVGESDGTIVGNRVGVNVEGDAVGDHVGVNVEGEVVGNIDGTNVGLCRIAGL